MTQTDSRAGLILVLSSERSGSTLFRFLVGKHSRVVAPPELFLMRYPDYRTWRSQKPEAIESVLEYLRLVGRPRSVAEVDTACDAMDTVGVYRWLLGHLSPGMFLVDKTPAYTNSLTVLRRSLPLTPHYVWLLRHPLAVIESHVRIKSGSRAVGHIGLLRRVRHRVRAALSIGGESSVQLARLREMKWVLQQTNVHTFLSSVAPEQQTVIRFEDLVRHPAEELANLCARMRLAVEPVMYSEVRGERLNPSLGDPNFHKHHGVDAGKALVPRGPLREAQLRYETRTLMQQVGIKPLTARA